MCSSRSPLITAVVWRTVSRTNGIFIAACAITVTSCALEYAPVASSPSGRTKCESVRPSDRAFAFISARERVEVGRDRERERVGGVVRGLDQGRLHQLAHGDLLAAAQVDALLADRGGVRVDRDDVA